MRDVRRRRGPRPGVARPGVVRVAAAPALARLLARRIVAGLALAGALAGAAGAAGQQVGPTRGTLLAAGGAVRDPAIVERFIDLAGGPDASIVLIPTAGGQASYDQDWPGAAPFRAAGAQRLTVLHTTDRATADSAAFNAPIRQAGGVWFGGGRQWRLADAYLHTTLHAELRALLDRGGVVGGSSAGATILGSYLVRGDTSTNTIMMGDHEEGFGLLRGVGIDQHLLRRNRHYDMVEVIRARPDLLGLGIDEDTAIVVRGDAFEVLGRGYVAIYDHTRRLDSGSPFYFLAPGDRYDLASRQAYRTDPDGRLRPFERVVDAPWPDATR